MTVKLVYSVNPVCYRPVSLIRRGVQVCSCRVTSEQLEASGTSVGFREEGGVADSPETDDDRSASPLMCTYLSIGELCHSSDLCTLRLPSPPTSLVPTPQPIPAQMQSQALLSPLPMQSVGKKNAGFIFGQNLHVSSPGGDFQHILMNDPVFFYSPESSGFQYFKSK